MASLHATPHADGEEPMTRRIFSVANRIYCCCCMYQRRPLLLYRSSFREGYGVGACAYTEYPPSYSSRPIKRQYVFKRVMPDRTCVGGARSTRFMYINYIFALPSPLYVDAPLSAARETTNADYQ